MTKTLDERRWHRVRFYPNVFSNFDTIEECKKPAPCLLCNYKHPICNKNGKVESHDQNTR